MKRCIGTAMSDVSRIAEVIDGANFVNLFGGEAGARTRSTGEKKRSIYDVVKEGVDMGAPDALIVAAVRAEFPESKFATDVTTARRNLAWYKNDYKRSKRDAK